MSNKLLKKILIIGGVFLIFLPQLALAQSGINSEVCKISDTDKSIHLQVNIPGVTNDEGNVKNLGCYIVGVYRYFVGIAGILATVMIMWGGVQYVVSFGNQQKVSAAKDTITAALVGLLLAMSSYAILYFINPNLTQFELPGIEPIPKLSDGWCEDRKLIEGPLTPKIENAVDCGDIGLLEGTNKTCYYEGDKCGDEYSRKVCTEHPKNSGVFECKPRVFEWNGLNICYQRSQQNCGVLIQGIENECTGINCGALSVCFGYTSENALECRESSVFFYPEDGQIHNITADFTVDCGYIKKTTTILFEEIFVMGSRCYDNEICLIIPLSGRRFFQEGDLRPSDPDIVGAYTENYCY